VNTIKPFLTGKSRLKYAKTFSRDDQNDEAHWKHYDGVIGDLNT
jgi:hypothetical protein